MSKPSEDSLVIQANEYFTDEDYLTAIDLYTQALQKLGESSYLLTKRAAAYSKNQSFEDSLDDSTRAIELDDANAMAHYRKGEALYNLDEPEAAQVAFRAALSSSRHSLGKAPKAQAERLLNKLQGNEPSAKAPTSAATKQPAADSASQQSSGASASTAPKQAAAKSTPPASASNNTTVNASQSASQPQKPRSTMTTTGPIRKTYDWSQTETHVTISIFARAAIKDKSEIEVKKKILSVSLAQSTGSDFLQDVLFYDEVVPQEYETSFNESSVDITVKKAKPGMWPCVNPYEKGDAATEDSNASGKSNPSYPSSVPKKKDWSALEKQIEEEEEEEAKNETDSNKGLQHLFQTIYRDADEDTRRAMVKSFVTSGGKALSTNWDEVKKKDYAEDFEKED